MDEQLITDLGGPTAVARELDQRPNTVGNWKLRGIPWKFRHRIAALAEQKGLTVPAAFLEAR
jgi:hypothetical protein